MLPLIPSTMRSPNRYPVIFNFPRVCPNHRPLLSAPEHASTLSNGVPMSVLREVPNWERENFPMSEYTRVTVSSHAFVILAVRLRRPYLFCILRKRIAIGGLWSGRCVVKFLVSSESVIKQKQLWHRIWAYCHVWSGKHRSGLQLFISKNSFESTFFFG